MQNEDDKSAEELEALKLELRKKLVDLIHHPNASKETKEELSEAVKSLLE